MKKIHEIKNEVGKDEYLFIPYSLTMDKNNNLFIYDKGQAKILVFDSSFKFIKSFGMVGNGPGEFSGSGKAFGIPIQIGSDGNLYAHDHTAKKVLVFKTDGKFSRQIKISPSSVIP
ncbi:MAG: 6-bladed beta-propeller [Acidobacteria bacterium]|nr:6-bladed beta-propeller [Acidobacteriota bacterium]